VLFVLLGTVIPLFSPEKPSQACGLNPHLLRRI